MVVGPRGAVIREEADGLLVAESTAEQMRMARAALEYTVPFRRPMLYGLLAKRGD
jgi:hypothetical protein